MLINTPKPLFITFEGGEGCGKTTQIAKLTELLKKTNIPIVITREPGGCESAETLRELLVTGTDDRWDGLSEVLLYSAARNEHLRTVIRPSLDKGCWVICDRFVDSTIVYQGSGRGISYDGLMNIQKLVIQDTWPDLTIILDGPVEKTLNRQWHGEENRFENLGIEFHRKVRSGFLKIAKENPTRCRVIDAIGSIEEVHKRILTEITSFTKAKGDS